MGKSPSPKTKWPLNEDERFRDNETYTRDRYTHEACMRKKRRKVIRQILRKKIVYVKYGHFSPKFGIKMAAKAIKSIQSEIRKNA